MITIAEQNQLWALIRVYSEATAEVAMRSPTMGAPGWQMAGRRFDKANHDLAEFVQGITVKEKKGDVA